LDLKIANCFLPERNTSHQKDIHRLKVKGWKNDSQAEGIWKQAGVAFLIFDKAYFKPKLLKTNKGGHYILVKRTIHQEDITIIICMCLVSI
jgi:hypothetical protein